MVSIPSLRNTTCIVWFSLRYYFARRTIWFLITIAEQHLLHRSFRRQVGTSLPRPVPTFADLHEFSFLAEVDARPPGRSLRLHCPDPISSLPGRHPWGLQDARNRRTDSQMLELECSSTK